MALPSIDVGLMNEHLAAHKGVIHKLNKYSTVVKEPYLKQLIHAQTLIMKNHVHVMLNLLDPNNHQWIQVIPLQHVFQQITENPIQQNTYKTDEAITLELHSTAKHMANNNFMSALMMKNDNVKQVHYDMALQQAHFEKLYSDYINKMDWSVTARVTNEEQVKVINHYKAMLYE